MLKTAATMEEVLKKYGRYPHRNRLLGRQETREEEIFRMSGKLDDAPNNNQTFNSPSPVKNKGGSKVKPNKDWSSGIPKVQKKVAKR